MNLVLVTSKFTVFCNWKFPKFLPSTYLAMSSSCRTRQQYRTWTNLVTTHEYSCVECLCLSFGWALCWRHPIYTNLQGCSLNRWFLKKLGLCKLTNSKLLGSQWQKDYEELKGNLLQLHIQRSPSNRLKWLTTPANILEQLPVNPLTPIGQPKHNFSSQYQYKT